MSDRSGPDPGPFSLLRASRIKCARMLAALWAAAAVCCAWAQAPQDARPAEVGASGDSSEHNTQTQRTACADAGPGVDACPDARVVVTTRGGAIEYPVRSLRALRDAGVVKQRFDYSCGSAALATLLTYGLNDTVGEDVLLRALLEPLSTDELAARQKKGLSLLDLQQLAQQRGHKAQGFRVAHSQLARLTRPVVVFIKPQGYEHFAVFKGLQGNRVHLADPSQGNVRMPLYRFLDMWADASGRGVIFAVETAAGDWPRRYALQLSGSADTPLEVLSAERLMTIGTTSPYLDPNR